ncbi:MAG: glycosyltransferase family 2 protein [Burkholderiales bacterium]|nr:glycosyltransferase family 2 protein [Burkholderiales bacterium]
MRRDLTDHAAESALDWQGAWIVIPAFGEAATIRAVAEASLARCPNVVVVDDGSRDGTRDRLEGLPLVLLAHDANRGKAASLRTAFAYVLARGGECAITLDGDGQHDPADLPRLLAAFRRHPGRVVIGARLHDRAAFPPSRWIGNRIACFWISWAAGHAIADSQTGLRVYPEAVMTMATDGSVRSSRFTFESEILIEAAAHAYPTIAVPVRGLYPKGNRPSHYRGVVDTARIVAMVAARLLRRALYLPGLWRSLRAPPEQAGEQRR